MIPEGVNSGMTGTRIYMNKFTIFTIILSVSVITVTADLVVRDYFDGTQANVLDEEVSPVLADDENTDTEDSTDSETTDVRETAPQEPATELAAVAPSPVIAPPQSRITEDIIRQAGFTSGRLQEKQFNGKLYQLLDITKTPVDGMVLYDILENDVGVVSVTEIMLRDEIRALQLYSLLQNKTKPYIDLSLNETNAYGDRSFYINHAKKPEEAFLTVKIGNRIYGFAYVKGYHPQVKALIQLLNS